jgi:hypothetical protein
MRERERETMKRNEMRKPKVDKEKNLGSSVSAHPGGTACASHQILSRHIKPAKSKPKQGTNRPS